ncbi:regulatory protein YcgZ [Pantoea anthophila]|uniref:regulatory protein YcgZ n=1 Tax=Pantoea anthophila TaxID=470931 RepID=UPI00332B4AFB
MLQIMPAANLNKEVAAYFIRAVMPSQQETLGAIVVEVLRSGRTLSRKAICLRLLARLDKASSPEEEQHLQELVSLLFSE